MLRTPQERQTEFDQAWKAIVEAHPALKLGTAKISRQFGLKGVDRIRIKR